MIHGPSNVKFINAQQARIIHIYENIKMKLYKWHIVYLVGLYIYYIIILLKHPEVFLDSYIPIITGCNTYFYLVGLRLLSKMQSSFPSVILLESTYCVNCLPNMIPFPAIPLICQYTKNIKAHFTSGDQWLLSHVLYIPMKLHNERRIYKGYD